MPEGNVPPSDGKLDVDNYASTGEKIDKWDRLVYKIVRVSKKADCARLNFEKEQEYCYKLQNVLLLEF